jgi:hypothetical protein
MFETRVAIQRLRKSAFCSGLHAERSAAGGAGGGGEGGAGGVGAVLKVAPDQFLAVPPGRRPSLDIGSSQLQRELVDIAPTPILSRLDGCDDRMLSGPKVLGRVPVLGLIAASDVSARPTQAKMHPGVAERETFLATLGVGA